MCRQQQQPYAEEQGSIGGSQACKTCYSAGTQATLPHALCSQVWGCEKPDPLQLCHPDLA